MLPEMGIHIGRDRLFAFLQSADLLIQPARCYRKTTDSYHRFHKYPNLIKELTILAPNQVFVSDITYLDTLEGFCYLALVTDLYSRKIVGWDLTKSLSIEGCQNALRQALKGAPNPENLIHHSDRGIQYCSKGYVDILQSKGIRISMTEENHCYENAVAERINGILKYEFMLAEKQSSFQAAYALTAQSIRIYNEERLHCSLNFQTPAQCYAA
jgi:putative transposase